MIIIMALNPLYDFCVSANVSKRKERKKEGKRGTSEWKWTSFSEFSILWCPWGLDSVYPERTWRISAGPSGSLLFLSRVLVLCSWSAKLSPLSSRQLLSLRAGDSKSEIRFQDQSVCRVGSFCGLERESALSLFPSFGPLLWSLASSVPEAHPISAFPSQASLHACLWLRFPFSKDTACIGLGSSLMTLS